MQRMVRLESKATGDAGEFVGMASVYGVQDQQGDVVDRGAFTQSIRDRGDVVPILWQHDTTSPIGFGRVIDTPDGLKLAGKLDLDTEQGRTAFSGLKKRYLKGLSIGYDVVRQTFVDGVRHLVELALYEVSTVTFPANQLAIVSGVKTVSVKSVSPRQSADEQLIDAMKCRTADMRAYMWGVNRRFDELALKHLEARVEVLALSVNHALFCERIEGAL